MSPEATCTHCPVVDALSCEDSEGAVAAVVDVAVEPEEDEVEVYVVPLVQSLPTTTVTSE
jgi:hypothetical protein